MQTRTYDDGFNDGKLGRREMNEKLFESNIDYQIYMNGYRDGQANSSWPNFLIQGSGIYKT